MINGAPVYRRHHQKLDGRDLFFYGYKPHTLEPLPEDKTDIAKGGELRFHPLRQEWNIYAPHRQNRYPLAPSKRGGALTGIPFTDFEIAIFENKFTSLHAQAPIPTPIEGLEMARAKGRCDVVVYGPEASGNLQTIGQAKRRLLIAAWIDRYETLFD